MGKIDCKKVAVTGAAGCIGSNLSEALLERGCTVVGIDNLSQGSKRNIEGFEETGRFELEEVDVRDFEKMEKVCKDVEVIFHLAAFKIPRYGGAINTLMVNAMGTKNVLDVAKERKQKVVFASTSDVYGKNPNVPFTEEHDFVIGQSNVPRWAYASSKIFDEQMCFAYGTEHELPFSIVRYFGGYGPRQHLNWYGGPQSVFINMVRAGKAIPLHGDGQQTRTFTFVGDQVAGTILAGEKKKALGEVFNIGNTKEITIAELAQLIHNLMGKEGEANVELIPYKNFGKYEDVRRRVPDISKARESLGFEPKVDVEEGLKLTIDWQLKQPVGEDKGELK